MNPVTKTLLIVIGSICGIFIAPALLIIFHDYLNAFFAITLFIACFVTFGIITYEEFYPEIARAQKEEEDIMHQFNGDKQKIKFYKGFKKYFDGDLNAEGLEHWFERHH